LSGRYPLSQRNYPPYLDMGDDGLFKLQIFFDLKS